MGEVKFNIVNPGNDSILNRMLDRAISHSLKSGCENLYCIYVLWALLQDEKGKQIFEEMTGVLKSKVELELRNRVISGEYGRISDMRIITEFKPEEYISDGVKELLEDIRKELSKRVFTDDELYVMLINKLVRLGDKTIDHLLDNIEDRAKVETNLQAYLEVKGEIGKTINDLVTEDLIDLAISNELKDVVGREEELDKIVEILGRKDKKHVCLVGKAGIGKGSIANGLAFRIIRGEIPEWLAGYKVLRLNSNGNMLLKGGAISNILGDLKGEKILVIEDADNVFDEMSNIVENDMLSLLDDMGVLCIFTSTVTGWVDILDGEYGYSAIMERINVEELSSEYVQMIVEEKKKEYSDFHRVTIESGVVEQIIKYSARFLKDGTLLAKSVELLDETCAKAKVLDKGYVDVELVKLVVSEKAGVKILEDKDSLLKLSNLADNLNKRVIGQEKAVDGVVRAIKRSSVGIQRKDKPVGSFLFVGPTGVGKTELAKVLASELSGNEKSLVRFDMSEYSESHTVSKLIGSPPGYVGYDKGGLLTNLMKENTNRVILFDEIEKAHEKVYNIFLQILDDGLLTDSYGEKVDFKDSTIIFTSNAGYGEGKKVSLGFGSNVTDREIKEEDVMFALEKTFRPELLNRLDRVVVFNKLSRENCVNIVKNMLDDLKKRINFKDLDLEWEDKVVDYLVEEGFSEKYGARNLRRKIEEKVEDVLADKIINLNGSKNDVLLIKRKGDDLVVEVNKK